MAKPDTQRLTASTRRRIKEPEGVDADFKETPKSIKAEDLVSFANSRGGTIFVGVKENTGEDGRQCGEVVGCDISDETRTGIINKAVQCSPVVDIEIVAENISTAKPILRVEISEGSDKPYGTQAGTYKRRVGGRNVAMDSAMIKSLVIESETEEFIQRFRGAGDAIIAEVTDVHHSLASAIDNVEAVAEQASQAAEDALAAAEEAAGY